MKTTVELGNLGFKLKELGHRNGKKYYLNLKPTTV